MSASLDQEMVRALGATRLGSLELGVSIPVAPAGRVQLSFAGQKRPRPAINDPRLVFDQILPGDGNTAAIQALAARRRSVLDGVKANLDRTLTVVISKADRASIQQHLESVRELEKSLDRVVPADCRRPEPPPATALTDQNNAQTLVGLQIELLSLAFACDATRVATLMVAEAGAERTSAPGGQRQSQQIVGGGLRTGPTPSAACTTTAISRWCAERLSELVRRLLGDPGGQGNGAGPHADPVDDGVQPRPHRRATCPSSWWRATASPCAPGG